MIKKECRKYYFSVEGETEKWYLEWLQNQINNIEDARYNVKFVSKITKNPNKMVKQMTVIGNVEILHVFDFEELQNEDTLKKTLSFMKKASQLKKRVKYTLGYCNYSFDLWIILHKECAMASRNHRSNYLVDINRCYNSFFYSMFDYKEEINFKKILDRLTLDNVRYAISNAEKISSSNVKNYHKIGYCGYEYYKENPSLNLYEFIRDILKTSKLL